MTPVDGLKPPVSARWLALAAMLMIGVALFATCGGNTAAPRSEAPPSTAAGHRTDPGIRDTLARLGRFDPPPYTTPRLRSPATTASFDAAMRRYADRDCDGAIPLLRSSARDRDHGESARFFLGICLLLTDQLDQGIAVLNALGDDSRSALAEDARFYKARGELLRGNAAAAIGALDRTIELGGEREREARALREAIKQATVR
jgi:hypothetical protein